MDIVCYFVSYFPLLHKFISRQWAWLFN